MVFRIPSKNTQANKPQRKRFASEEVIDVKPRRPRWVFALALIALAGLSGAGIWIWHGPYRTWDDRRSIEIAMAAYEGNLEIKNTTRKLQLMNIQRNPKPIELYLLSDFFYGIPTTSEKETSIFEKARLASLRESMRMGSDLATIELAKIKRESAEGEIESVLGLLEGALQRAERGAKAGDPVSIYTLAYMKALGLATQLDPVGAQLMVQRVADQLPPGLKIALSRDASLGAGIFKDNPSEDIAIRLSEELLRDKFFGLRSPCALPVNLDKLDSFVECSNSWVKKSAYAGDISNFAAFGSDLLSTSENLAEPVRWLNAAPADTVSVNNKLKLILAELAGSSKTAMQSKTSLSKLRGDLFKQNPTQDWFASQLLPVSLSLDKIDRKVDAKESGFLKALVVYRAVAEVVTSKAQKDLNSVLLWDTNARKPRWLSLIQTPRVVGASRSLAAALQSGNDLDAALAQIDALEKPEPLRFVPLSPDTQAKQDPDYRARSGNIGEQLATDGLSSFTVDNSQGDTDVVVRLYRDGKLPAVRSFIVKKGDTYTSEKIAAGNYVMRHRTIGKTKTYEANDVFRLTETRTEEGTRFSRIRVTMYRVKDGNLTNKEVPPDQF